MTAEDRRHQAELDGAAGRVRAVLRRAHDERLEARQRAEWPELWEAIDSLVEVQDQRDARAERRPLF